MEQILFDFEKDGIKAFDRLDSILFSSNWKHLTISKELSDTETRLLFPLVRSDLLRIFECRYAPSYGPSTELRRKADQLAYLLHKRHVSQSLFDVLTLFAKHEPDPYRNEFNAMSYPDLKAYVRCGDLTPKNLFEMLGIEDCEKIFIFQDTSISENESAYYMIECTLPRQKLFEILEEMRQEALLMAYKQMERSRQDIIPPLSKEESKPE
jgi:hypothetical protein